MAMIGGGVPQTQNRRRTPPMSLATSTVTFVDAKTTVDAIAEGSAGTGFPAKPIQ